MEAALELFGTNGYAATTVKQICERAGLTERYFYESFSDREDCLVETYMHIMDPIRALTVETILASGDEPELMAERGLRTFIAALAEDPRKAQIVFIQVIGVSPRLETMRHGMLNQFAELVVNVWLSKPGSTLSANDRWLLAVGLVGSVQHLFGNWLLDGHRRPYEQLVDASVRLFSAARAQLT
jgi:AcrR family transcriptional regulator